MITEKKVHEEMDRECECLYPRPLVASDAEVNVKNRLQREAFKQGAIWAIKYMRGLIDEIEKEETK